MSEIAVAVVSWLWEQYGKELLGKSLKILANKALQAQNDKQLQTLTAKTREELANKWGNFKWQEAEALYRSRLRDQHRFTRLLGNPKPIEIESIYTDVYILDQLSAVRRYSIEEMQKNIHEPVNFSLEKENIRRPLLRLAITEKRLYLLGKPGAGKTTFLRYLTLQACSGKIQETPIFVELKDWAASGLELMPYLVHQFKICAIPDAEDFIRYLLEQGHSLVLFDGLDEVNQEGEQRAKMIRELKVFANQFPQTQICLTCRIAATDYSFERFTYLEIADFNEIQVQHFAKKWYQDDQEKSGRFLKELGKPENKGLKELTSTPLLLALLCLAFDQTLEFPINRTDLYKEAFDALLKKWDATRNIRRDKIYQNLSPARREKMLARIAYQNFEKGIYFITEKVLAKQITAYLQQSPGGESTDEIEGEVVLKAIEAQHGILVERAHYIYSFSHLTLQEYLTAHYIVENIGIGTLEKLITTHFTDNRWREVFLMTASLLDDAGEFFDIFLQSIKDLLRNNPENLELMRWAYQIALPKLMIDGKYCNENLLIIISYVCANASDLAIAPISDRARELACAITSASNFAKDLALARSGTCIHARDLAKALTSDHDRISQLALELASDLARDRDLALTLSNDLNRAIELVNALYRELAAAIELAVASASDLAIAFANNRDTAFANNINRASARIRDRFRVGERILKLADALSSDQKCLSDIEHSIDVAWIERALTPALATAPADVQKTLTLPTPASTPSLAISKTIASLPTPWLSICPMSRILPAGTILLVYL